MGSRTSTSGKLSRLSSFFQPRSPRRNAAALHTAEITLVTTASCSSSSRINKSAIMPIKFSTNTTDQKPAPKKDFFWIAAIVNKLLLVLIGLVEISDLCREAQECFI